MTVNVGRPIAERSRAGEGFIVTRSGRMRVCAISAGWGSSGYYAPAVLEQAARAQLIRSGTHLYLDHPADREAIERPGRSVRDIAAVFTAAATYDSRTASLVGDVEVVSPYRDLLADLAPHIGLSISGSATDVTIGEAEGRTGPIIEGLAAIDSVDFVTQAGRGGRVLELIEAARVTGSPSGARPLRSAFGRPVTPTLAERAATTTPWGRPRHSIEER